MPHIICYSSSTPFSTLLTTNGLSSAHILTRYVSARVNTHLTLVLSKFRKVLHLYFCIFGSQRKVSLKVNDVNSVRGSGSAVKAAYIYHSS